MKIYENRVNSIKKKRLSLDELYGVISNGDAVQMKKFKTVNYDEFYNIIKYLEEEKILISKGRKLNANPLKPLFLSYERVIDGKQILTEEEKIFVHNLHSSIYKYSYQRNVAVLRKDREMLIKLDKFLRENDSREWLSVKERSQSIFNDEKLLQDSGIMRRTKLSYDDLKCMENPSPLLCFPSPSFYSKKVRKILIIENLDTYWTFHKIIMSEGLMPAIDMIIFGGGYGITNKNYDFSFYGINENDMILYFGDLDSEGLRIYLNFKEKFNQLNINLYLQCYDFLIDIGIKQGFRNMSSQNSVEYKLLEKDIKELTEEKKKIFYQVLKEKLFIPQEALNIEVLRGNKQLWIV
ncbi:hypothetical protein JHL18_15620 [Clostridium sp. YIM B02505]|uniref:Wadjet protein JetD C-terminal domain-containing protein n=1 Tax=Clostridium yunnanense TaxID=2800325 RepID=A0ABS1ERR6_9CLOT|nr:Wadjet anti-phage system protein JetD domain-containing protein [Clostridium yunnanense]MBK1812051.1 hypothetical protein [Clostridium yunnanense]